MESRELFLLRHGDTGYGGRYIGTTDLPIANHARKQIRKASLSLQNHKIELTYCSPMLRCQQTLDYLTLDCPVKYDEQIKEIDFGLWEKRSFSEIEKDNQELINHWVSDFASFSFPEGESVELFRKRISKFISTLYERPEKKILIVSHGGVIRHMICLLLNLPLEKYISFDIKPGTYSSLELFEDGATLTGLNM